MNEQEKIRKENERIRKVLEIGERKVMRNVKYLADKFPELSFETEASNTQNNLYHTVVSYNDQPIIEFDSTIHRAAPSGGIGAIVTIGTFEAVKEEFITARNIGVELVRKFGYEPFPDDDILVKNPVSGRLVAYSPRPYIRTPYNQDPEPLSYVER